MAGLFLSHSSLDKPFVTKLAIDLVNRGMPVWFDTWQMDTGDSLTKRINDGIGESDFLVIVLSPSSVSSEWVKKELEVALSLEEEQKRNFVVPVRIGDCEVPPAIVDRLYADFRDAYLEPLDHLVSRLGSLGVNDLDEPPDHALIPLTFEKGVFLDQVQLGRRLKLLKPRLPEGFEFRAEQFVIAPNDDYRALRQRLFTRVEQIEADRFFTPAFSTDIRSRLYSFTDKERYLVEGLCLMVNAAVGAERTLYDVGEACHWYARLLRSEMLRLLWETQDPGLDDILDFGRDYHSSPLQKRESAARFFEVPRVESVDVGPRATSSPGTAFAFARLAESQMVYVDEATLRSVKSAIVCAVHSIGESGLFGKYLVPQLTRRYVADKSLPISFTFDDWYVGLH